MILKVLLFSLLCSECTLTEEFKTIPTFLLKKNHSALFYYAIIIQLHVPIWISMKISSLLENIVELVNSK